MSVRSSLRSAFIGYVTVPAGPGVWGVVGMRATLALYKGFHHHTIDVSPNLARTSKAMTTSEMVALGQSLEALERPRAEARLREGGRRGGSSLRPDELRLEDSESSIDTRATVAQALGTSPSNYYRAKFVVKAAEAGDPQWRV